MPALAGFEWSLWSIFLFVFVIGPALGWGWRSGSRWRMHWGMTGWDGRAERGERRPSRAMAAELERRDLVIEQLEGRVAELENRLDFAERLLATHRPPRELAPAAAPAAAEPSWPRP
jgi:hypothetical protein